MKNIKSLALGTVNRCLRSTGYSLVRNNASGGYLDAKATVEAAGARGQTVCEFVETLWGQEGATARVVGEMSKMGCLSPCQRVLEIGPGTGRYLEPVLKEICPRRYEIYETADDWATWLALTYGPSVVRQPADGRTLRQTPDESCGLVHAHGVFVYLSFLHAFEYFTEMIRVCRPQGYIVFDFFPAEAFDETMIARWLESPDRYPVILPAKHVQSYYMNRGCEVIHEFDNPYGHGFSHYLVFRLVHKPGERDAVRIRHHSYI